MQGDLAMKKKFLLLSILLLVVAFGADAQYKFVKVFPDSNFLKTSWLTAVNNGIAVDPSGKIWIQTFSGTVDSLAPGVYTGSIYVFNPNGTQASFSPIRILTGKTETGATVTDTLNGTGYGLTVDPSTGNILSVKPSSRLWKIDYKTGKGIQRIQNPIPGYATSLATPAVDKFGEVFVAPVISPAPITILSSDFHFEGTVTNTTIGFMRCLAVSPDGNDVYAAQITAGTGKNYVYHSNNGSLGPYVLKDSVMSELVVESVAWHPKTGDLWASSGNVLSGMPTGGKWAYAWYGYNVSTRKYTDSIKWNGPVDSDPRPRGIAFSPTGDTIYVAQFNGAVPCVQMFVKSSISNPPNAPTLSSPANGSSGNPLNPTLTWNGVSGATSYQLQVSTNSSFSALIVDAGGLASTSYSMSGLVNNTLYYWRVNATNANGTSGWSTAWSFTTVATGESILRLAPFAVSGQYLNEQIAADTVANGKLTNRVYMLQRGGVYRANSVMQNYLWTLRIRANDSTASQKPVIFLYPNAATGVLPAEFITALGDVELRNLTLSGYYEPADTNLRSLQGALLLIPATTSGWKITIDSCILSNTSGNHIRTAGAASAIKVTSTIFANMGYLGESNLGAGRAIDLREQAIDTLILQNCTFINWHDRIVRHLDYSSGPTGAATGIIGYFKFDHNTLVNGMSYHGLLSLGSLGANAIITNNLFLDPFALGNDVDATRQVEFVPSGEKDASGNYRMTWISSVPNSTTQWTVSNNYYAVSDSGQAFYNQFASAGVAGVGSPLTWHINSRLGADSVNAFRRANILASKVPALMTKLMRWYRAPNGGNKTKNTPAAWVFGDINTHPYADPYDFDRKNVNWLTDSLNCSYSASVSLMAAGGDGKIIGDTRWKFLGIQAGTSTITSFSPTSGPVGTTVTITGTNFNATASNSVVYFGAVKAGIVAASPTSLTVTVPSGATYSPISVTDITTGLTAYSAKPFGVTFQSNHVIDTTSFAQRVNLSLQSIAHQMTIVDIDGDGRPDIAGSIIGDFKVSVLRNISTSGGITATSFAPKVDLPSGASPLGLAYADIDGDGKLDLIVVNKVDATVSVFRNTSTSGSITTASFAPRVDFATGRGPLLIAVADIDGDGRPDLVVSNGDTTTVSVLRNISLSGTITSGSFAPKVDFAAGNHPLGVAVADIDGDGKPDVAVANLNDSTISVLRNISSSGTITSGSLAPPVTFATGSGPRSMAIVDIDGDGKPDLVTNNMNSNTVSVLRNVSTSGSINAGSFAPKVEFAAGNSQRYMAISDIDGDGKPDLVVTNGPSNTVSVFRNTSTIGNITTGSFAASVDFATGNMPWGVGAGDTRW